MDWYNCLDSFIADNHVERQKIQLQTFVTCEPVATARDYYLLLSLIHK